MDPLLAFRVQSVECLTGHGQGTPGGLQTLGNPVLGCVYLCSSSGPLLLEDPAEHIIVGIKATVLVLCLLDGVGLIATPSCLLAYIVHLAKHGWQIAQVIFKSEQI